MSLTLILSTIYEDKFVDENNGLPKGLWNLAWESSHPGGRAAETQLFCMLARDISAFFFSF